MEHKKQVLAWESPVHPSRFAAFLLCGRRRNPTLFAGGPKYVAGTAYFDPAVVGQPVHWSGGVVNYYVDQGPLNSQITNQQATAMVDAAAAIWSAVPTAGVILTDAGSLNEDVSGDQRHRREPGIRLTHRRHSLGDQLPAGRDLTTPTARSSTASSAPAPAIPPAARTTASSVARQHPTRCHHRPRRHPAQRPLRHKLQPHRDDEYELERAFGRILGLDYAQVNPGASADGEPNAHAGWPVMHPLSGVCGPAGGICIPNPDELRYDDIAALNRIYPITASNLATFPGKQITAANTVSIQGTISFRTGTGMQGVNVVARPLDANGNPLYQYTVTFVSGAYFSGNHGNPITGWTDPNGNPFAQWGSNDPALQGFFDLSGIPLPPGMTTANYQVTFEAINPLYMLTESVGPYVDGSPSAVRNDACDLRPQPVRGQRTDPHRQHRRFRRRQYAGRNRLARHASHARTQRPVVRPPQPGGPDRLVHLPRARRPHLHRRHPGPRRERHSHAKPRPCPPSASGTLSSRSPLHTVNWAPALNGYATGETWLQVTASADDIVRLGIADMRGDGRPDYAYNGWVLYADTVQPPRLPADRRSHRDSRNGLSPSDTVLVGGQKAVVTSISPNEITAIAPPAAARQSPARSTSRSMTCPSFMPSRFISGGISYDSGTGDSLTLNTAPANTVPIGVPIPFTVTALGPDLAPAGGVTVTFSVVSGNATPRLWRDRSARQRPRRRLRNHEHHGTHVRRLRRHSIAHQRRQPAGPFQRRNTARFWPPLLPISPSPPALPSTGRRRPSSSTTAHLLPVRLWPGDPDSGITTVGAHRLQRQAQRHRHKISRRRPARRRPAKPPRPPASTAPANASTSPPSARAPNTHGSNPSRAPTRRFPLPALPASSPCAFAT